MVVFEPFFSLVDGLMNARRSRVIDKFIGSRDCRGSKPQYHRQVPVFINKIVESWIVVMATLCFHGQHYTSSPLGKH